MKIGNYNKTKTGMTLQKRISLVTFAGVIALGVTTYSFFNYRQSIDGETTDQTTNVDVKEEHNNFKMLYIDDFSCRELDELLTKLEVKGEKVGLIVDVLEDTPVSIYKRIDEIKDIIKNHNITYPICLNLDAYASNNDYTTSDLSNMVAKYISKLEANGCYTCVMGHQEILDDLSNYAYHKVLVTNHTVVDPRQYDMVIFGNNCDNLGHDIADIIIRNGMNQPDKLVDDLVYEIKQGDILHLQELFGMSLDELCEYNGITDPNTLALGDQIIIPSIYGNQIKDYDASFKLDDDSSSQYYLNFLDGCLPKMKVKI